MKKNNKGFSLIELIIVIAIMAVLIGVLAPEYVKILNKSKRKTDVTVAGQIVQHFQVLGAYYNGFGYNVYKDPLGGPNGICGVGWQLAEMEAAYGMTEEEIIEEWSQPNPASEINIGGALFKHLGEIPVSQTNPDYYWSIAYDSSTGEVHYVYLLDVQGGVLQKQMELYPNPDAFLEGMY